MRSTRQFITASPWVERDVTRIFLTSFSMLNMIAGTSSLREANMHSRMSVGVKALTMALLISSVPAVAQTIVSTLRGRVTDPQGAVVVGATVTARQVATNLTRTSHSD